ncbi:hypothetical protein PR202_ga09294 [Eleusine coracana subsp. coracana]|uniref:Uncharacterized protein n=1 Tax=Eleusine coracana subsp. coracana TaxID=191504 RepID=A0AAV5C3W1_ELECO|nr:hypothetical protein PR202_ga09294 [Eleusine coracana subsp. coracana]
MAGKQFPSLAHTRAPPPPPPAAPSLSPPPPYPPRCLLLSSSSCHPRPAPPPPSFASPSATTSFLASLDHFLAAPHPSASSAAPLGDLDDRDPGTGGGPVLRGI